MQKIVELVRPRSAGQWLVATMALVLALLFGSFTAIGETALQRLHTNGEDVTVTISSVLERDDAGVPTKVLTDSNWDGKAHELEDLEGSLEGTNAVRVRSYPADQTMMSQTAFRHSSVARQTLGLVLGPLLLGLLVIVALNARRTFRKESQSYWAVDSGTSAGDF